MRCAMFRSLSLPQSSSFEESAFLLMTGHLPTADEFVRFKKSLARNAHLPQVTAFRHASSPLLLLRGLSCS